jgi:D-serine deaminase-like pyridoxal phosphate-dependent protein
MTRFRSLEELPTPALVVDGPVLVGNIQAMAERALRAGVEMRPHVKTHKSPPIAELQREHGAAGFTAATLREAEMLVAHGHDDILLAYPPVGEWRLERLVELAQKARVRVVLDSAEALAGLDAACRLSGVAIGWLWEVDSGVRRIGSAPGEETAQRVAPLVRRYHHATFDGLMTFAGHAYGARSHDELREIAASERSAVRETAEAFAALGVEARARSVGTTPTSHQLVTPEGVTEIRPGNYVFYDATQVALQLVSENRCALSVIATVVARPDPRRLILDCGSKALAAERLTERTSGFGLVPGRPELVVERLFEEHAIVVAAEPLSDRIGERLRVVPNHSCASANLHDRLVVVDGVEIVDEWPVEARGWRRKVVLPVRATTG